MESSKVLEKNEKDEDYIKLQDQELMNKVTNMSTIMFHFYDENCERDKKNRNELGKFCSLSCSNDPTEDEKKLKIFIDICKEIYKDLSK